MKVSKMQARVNAGSTARYLPPRVSFSDYAVLERIAESRGLCRIH